MRTFRHCVPVVVLALFLGACQFVTEEPVVESPPETTEPEVQAEVVQEVAALPPSEPDVPPPPPPPIPVPDPGSLMGYSEAGLEGLFGAPTFLRRDPPAELWQYHTDACVLDLFLYEDVAGSYLVDHIEFRETGHSASEKEDCLREIILSMGEATG